MSDAHRPYAGALLSGRFEELEDALCERVSELRDGRPLAPLTIVVGSAAVRTRIGDRLVRELGAVANVRIVTLGRLAADLVAEARGAPPRVLAGLARERLVRQLIESHRGRLAYFGPVIDRPHFAAALAATFADLREGLVDPRSPWAGTISAAGGQVVGAATGSATPARRAKTADLDALYTAYCDVVGGDGPLEEALVDGAGLHLAAAEVVRAAGRTTAGGRGHVVVYGIYDLNTAQAALLQALIASGADVFVPVPPDPGEAGAVMLGVALAGGMVEKRLDPRPARRDVDRVTAFLSDSSAAERTPLALAADGTVRVVSVSDERAEAREAVRAIVTAAVGRDAREGGVSVSAAPLRDCAVVVPHGDDVERLASALRDAGLPVACRLPDRSVGVRLATRLADCVAPAAGEPFARRAVVDLLTTAPLRGIDTDPGTSAVWLDEARRVGIVAGLDEWCGRCGARVAGLRRAVAALDDLPTAERDVEDEAVADRAALERRLAAASALHSAALLLAEACDGLETLRAPWGVWADRFEAAVESLFAPPASEMAREAIGRLRGLSVVPEEVGADEAAGVVRDLLDRATVHKGRVGREGVAVVTPLELRGLRFHTIVVIGLTEGMIPARGRPDPILGDGEREAVDAARGHGGVGLPARLPRAADRGAESELLFALACAAARERLVLIAPRTEVETGRPRLTSRLLLRLATAVTGAPVGHDAFVALRGLEAPVWTSVSGSPTYRPAACTDGRSAAYAHGSVCDEVVWVDRCERDARVMAYLSRLGATVATSRFLASVLGDDGAARRRLGAWSSARSVSPTVWDGVFDDDARAALVGLPESRRPLAGEVSPTRLERYLGCPFAFLLRDVYGLEPPDEPGAGLEIDHLEFGSLVHDILESAVRQVMSDGLGLDGALEAVARACDRLCDDAERRGVTGSRLSWDVRRDMVHEDLAESTRRDPVFAAGDGRPVAVEWAFGDKNGRPVVLDLGDGRRARFRGRVDRFDATPSGARVVDYKTGRGATEEKRIKDGLSVQLPVYRLAVRTAAGAEFGAIGEIESQYRFVTRRGGFATVVLPDSEQASIDRLRELVRTAIDLVLAGKFPRSTEGRCDYCDVKYACGVTSWARARKREHEGLADVVGLQRPPSKEAGDEG